MAFLLIATYTDLKQRIVSNKLNYSMIILGIALHAIFAFLTADAMIFVYCIAATIIAFVFSYGLWKIGAWAGGDVKLITALSALNPVNPAMLASSGIMGIGLLQPISLPVFPFSIFVFSIFSMVPYAAFVSMQRLSKNKKIKQEFLSDLAKKLFSSMEFAMAITGIGAVLLLYRVNLLVEIPLLFAYGFIKPKFLRIGIALVLLASALWLDFSNILWLVWLVIIFIGGFLLLRLYALSKKLLRQKVRIEKLEEGMIPAETLVQQGAKIIKSQNFEIKKVINYIIHNKLDKLQEQLKPKGREIISSSRAAGLEPGEIKELKKLAKEKKIPGEIEIRESVAFVPAILIGYVILNIVGDLLWNWLFLH